MTTTQKKITITLSDRSPVSIVASEWPTIAKAEDWTGGGVRVQANEEMVIRVRRRRSDPTDAGPIRSADVLVYGTRDRGDGGMPMGYRGRAAGYLLTTQLGAEVPQADIVRAIRRVAGVIGWEDGASECIADLPAEDI